MVKLHQTACVMLVDIGQEEDSTVITFTQVGGRSDHMKYLHTTCQLCQSVLYILNIYKVQPKRSWTVEIKKLKAHCIF